LWLVSRNPFSFRKQGSLLGPCACIIMILELLEYLMTPCPAAIRSMGFLSSAIKVRARYRRCKRAWSPHIEQTRRIVLEAVNRCRGRRKVVVLGAGLLHDIPLKELSQTFGKVLLVDIVHPLSSRLSTLRFRNVEQISYDVTEVMGQLRHIAHLPGRPLPISRPMKFLDDRELDLTLSVNLLSQLPQVPAEYLYGFRDEATIDTFRKHLIEAHLDYLCHLPGHTALITDVTVRRMTGSGMYAEEWDALHGVKLPPAESSWEWHLAPSPEVASGMDLSTTVVAYADWKKAAGPPK